jgi:hypothetical protein
MKMEVETVLGAYQCREYFNGDLDHGIEISRNENYIGKILGIQLPDEEGLDEFINTIEIWVCEND